MNRRTFLNSVLTGGVAAQLIPRTCQGIEPTSVNTTDSCQELLAGVDSKERIKSADHIVIKGARGLEWILIRLQTDQGVAGIGECWPWSQENVIECIRTVTEAAKGINPLEVFSFSHRLSQKNKGLAWSTAVSGVEIALWDIIGQLAGLPVYELLGGRKRDRIPLYANHGIFLPDADSMQSRIERALAAKEAGFSALKWDPTTPYGPRGRKNIDEIVNEIAAFRQAVGPDFALAIDAHNNLSLQGATALAKQLERFDLLFFEAPVLWPEGNPGRNRPDALKKVAAETNIPIAIGEWLSDRIEAESLIRDAQVGVIQPEVVQIGGIHAMWKVATFAGKSGIKVTPHHWTGPVAAVAAAQVSASISNLLRQEYAAAVSNFPWENELLYPPLEINNGQLVVSQRPGLGVKLNEELVSSRRI